MGTHGGVGTSMDDCENSYNEAIGKAQEAFEDLKENAGTDLKTEIESMRERVSEIEASREEISEDFKQLCRDFVAIESEYGLFLGIKQNLIEASAALGIEGGDLNDLPEAIEAKCDELQTENTNLKALIEAAGDINDECELLETECESMRDSVNQLEVNIAKVQEENGSIQDKYKKRRKKLKKLLILKGISEWNSSD